MIVTARMSSWKHAHFQERECQWGWHWGCLLVSKHQLEATCAETPSHDSELRLPGQRLGEPWSPWAGGGNAPCARTGHRQVAYSSIMVCRPHGSSSVSGCSSPAFR